MVDGVTGRASEGLPRARFVLRKALERRRPDCRDRSKIDRGDARAEVLSRSTISSSISTRSGRLDFVLYERASRDDNQRSSSRAPRGLRPLFDAIATHVPAPRGDPDAPLQLLVANLDSSDYLGRIAIGRIFNGRVKVGDSVVVCKLDRRVQETKVTKLYAFDGLKRVDINEASAGDIVCLAGIDDITIGETIADVEARVPIPPTAIDEPTVSIIFGSLYLAGGRRGPIR
jgi:GTP-binding protein